MRKRFILWVLVLLQATPFVAKDADRRTAKERMFLEGYKGLVIKNGKKVVVK